MQTTCESAGQARCSTPQCITRTASSCWSRTKTQCPSKASHAHCQGHRSQSARAPHHLTNTAADTTAEIKLNGRERMHRGVQIKPAYSQCRRKRNPSGLRHSPACNTASLCKIAMQQTSEGRDCQKSHAPILCLSWRWGIRLPGPSRHICTQECIQQWRPCLNVSNKEILALETSPGHGSCRSQRAPALTRR